MKTTNERYTVDTVTAPASSGAGRFRWEIRVPAIPFYCPPLQFASISAAVRRAKKIARANPHATVDVYHVDGTPIFALGASLFSGCSAGIQPQRCWSAITTR